MVLALGQRQTPNMDSEGGRGGWEREGEKWRERRERTPTLSSRSMGPYREQRDILLTSRCMKCVCLHGLTQSREREGWAHTSPQAGVASESEKAPRTGVQPAYKAAAKESGQKKSGCLPVATLDPGTEVSLAKTNGVSYG